MLVGVAACGGGDPDGAARLPDVELATLDGGTVDLGEPTTLPRVVNLWATWCAPCRVELPVFEEVASDAEDEVEFLGVNVGDDADSARAMADELGLTFPQALDPESALDVALEVVNMPTTAFVRPDGTVVATHSGAVDRDELVALVDEHLGVDLG